MTTNIHFVGLDYHTDFVQVCVMNDEGQVLTNRDCDNDWQAIARCVPGGGGQVRAAIEACNGTASLADELVGHAQWSVDLAHAGYVARIKQNPDKTDFGDAELLADLERVGYLPRVWLAPQAIRELRRVVRYRHHLVKQRRAVKLRVGALVREQRPGPPPASRWTRRWIEWVQNSPLLSEQARWIITRHVAELAVLRTAIDDVKQHLAEMTRDDPLVARLVTHKGIALVTACVLRAEIGRFDRFRSGKQLSRFCGLSPRNASSGSRQADAGLVGACSRTLRATIIEAAHRLARWEPRWKSLSLRLRARGKATSLAVAAVANRWMRWLYHEMAPLGLGC